MNYSAAIADSLLRRVCCQSGFKILVQHPDPGRTRNQGVAHGPISPLEFGEARGVESPVGRWVESPSHRAGAEPSPEPPVP